MYIDSSVYNNAEHYINNMSNESIKIETSTKEYSKDSSNNQFDKQWNDDNQFNKKELDKSLNKLNRFLEDESVHAEYSVHEDFGTVMIKIIDDATKEVILEVPPKKILDMVASMCKQFGLLDKKA
ncbi:flagellar protein FlaG [Clostridium sp. SM-530-WT-3G]|uniref:flagellar protein FlaG n=1 Tax=Clostridium sp. SM-530-WT-3G TaxID=2725303 RepID=UPI00145F0164|nr:flagellar protein FlaG [Clostridium sp. SM-530-WT-3G]NME82797.1 flagellar protein FlaG [Clostridium sp. SM-530-WT-3G]